MYLHIVCCLLTYVAHEFNYTPFCLSTYQFIYIVSVNFTLRRDVVEQQTLQRLDDILYEQRGRRAACMYICTRQFLPSVCLLTYVIIFLSFVYVYLYTPISSVRVFINIRYYLSFLRVLRYFFVFVYI